MSSVPPVRLGGPPPGATPAGLSSMVRDQTADTPTGGQGGIARIFYAIEKQLDSLASAIPESSETIDEVKAQLREVLAKAISGGAKFQGADQSSGLDSSSAPDAF